MKQDFSKSVSHFAKRQNPARPAALRSFWWTEQRIAKLRYVMETYDDIAKASRVLGCSKGAIVREWNNLKYQDKANSK